MPEPTQPAATPPRAITAAAGAIWDLCRPGSGVPGDLGQWCNAIARAALEAAAPHLEAAAAERLATWLEGPEAAAVTANAIRGQVDREIAEAVAAERERLFVVIRRALPLSAPWRGEALDLIAKAWGQP